MNALTIHGGNATPMTMTSLEISRLVEQRHDNVKRTIETLGGKGVVTLPQLEEVPNDGPGPKNIGVYNLGKRDSLIVVAQLCPEFTARIVDRWQELEEQAAKPALNPANLTRLQLIEMAMQAEQERLVLEHKVGELAPKAEALDRIADAEGTMNPTVAAKNLQVQPKQLFDWMRQHGWIYRRPGGSGNVAYQDKIQAGYLTHKVTTVEREDGSEKVVEQVLVTAKGLAKLSGVFSRGAA
ncbi:phage antirepressor KilAC domain-containing protein [Methyloversatilis sp.]|uniref:phage antirepressor KilAC domain-containing protein n=1 Tax=Methyloversatilis sp. TaxID=2569862 RepID=UPI0027B976F6|nr:phage antirepressor KilAC domain-containing protein [Methyloversatilis sp.]